jgi:hypothetical protein
LARGCGDDSGEEWEEKLDEDEEEDDEEEDDKVEGEDGAWRCFLRRCCVKLLLQV